MSAAVAFGPTANPDAYVPWSGAERALAALMRWARRPSAPLCVLAGGPGMGKTLLLKLLASRTRELLQPIHLTYPDRDPDSLCELLGDALGVARQTRSAAELITALRTHEDRPLLLLVDEAEILPPETARRLLDVAAGAAGRLRAVLAVTRDECAAELSTRFGVHGELVRIEGTMTQDEVAAHVHTQLARAGVDPRLAARFDPTVLARLHASSEGVPASLQSLAAGMLFEAQLARGELAVPRPGISRAPVTAPPTAAPSSAPPRPAAGPAAVQAPPRAVAPTPKPPPPIEPAHEPVPAPPTRPSGRVPAFVLGLGLGVLVGIGAAQRAPEWIASRATPVASAPAATSALPPVATAPKQQPVEAPVAPVLPPVSVSFNSDPWARIELDGEPIGVTPIAAHAVAPGLHRVTARLADGRVLDRELEIGAESNRRIVFP